MTAALANTSAWIETWCQLRPALPKGGSTQLILQAGESRSPSTVGLYEAGMVCFSDLDTHPGSFSSWAACGQDSGSRGLLASWWRWPSSGCAFPKEPLTCVQSMSAGCADCFCYLLPPRCLMGPERGEVKGHPWPSSGTLVSEGCRSSLARAWIWTLAVSIIKFHFRTNLFCSPILKKKSVLTIAGVYLPLCPWKQQLNPGLKLNPGADLPTGI